VDGRAITKKKKHREINYTTSAKGDKDNNNIHVGTKSARIGTITNFDMLFSFLEFISPGCLIVSRAFLVQVAHCESHDKAL